MTRTELMRRISAYEFREWLLLEQMEPFGEMGEYLRAGRLAAIIANVNRGKHSKAYEPADFMPELRPVKAGMTGRAQTPEEMHAIFAQFKQNREKRKSG